MRLDGYLEEQESLGGSKKVYRSFHQSTSQYSVVDVDSGQWAVAC